MNALLRRFSFEILCCALFAGLGTAQSLGSLTGGKKAKPASGAAAALDPLNRATPRRAMHSFLEACHDGNLEKAAQYLDLKSLSAEAGSVEGPRLAQQLCKLLDRNVAFEVSKLSDEPEGKRTDGLAVNTDDLARFNVNGETVTLHLVRADRQPFGPLWLVSAASVSQLPELGSSAGH